MTSSELELVPSPPCPGGLRDPSATAAAEAAVTVMLDQLVWWADALRVARAAQPA